MPGRCRVDAAFMPGRCRVDVGLMPGRCRVDAGLMPGRWVAPWLRGRASDSRLREPGFEYCAAVLKPWASFITLRCSSSISCINEYLAIDSGGYVYEHPSRINCSIWLDAS